MASGGLVTREEISGQSRVFFRRERGDVKEANLRREDSLLSSPQARS
jgi:hypothetical protein